MVRVLFICMGNICRSPMAEAVFIELVKRAGLADQIEIDSAGTDSWHAGERAHHGTREVLRRQGIVYEGCARQVTRADLQRFDYVVAMDSENLAGLRQLDRAGAHQAKVTLLLDYAPEGSPRDVPDPYYTGQFDYVYQLVRGGCEGLLGRIRVEHGI